MKTLNLRKLLAQPEVLSIIQEMLNIIGNNIGIYDSHEKLLIGQEQEKFSISVPIQIEGLVIGWIRGDSTATAIASLLNYLTNRELERKKLAQEALDKYQEINLIYTISDKLTANLKLQEVTKILIEEIKKRIAATSGAIMLLDPDKRQLEIISAFGQQYHHKSNLIPITGIIGHVLLEGRGEIVNDVLTDPRFMRATDPLNSLICVPLLSKDKAIGIISISSEDSTFYKAADLKIIKALATQVTSAIANAILHEKMLREQQVISKMERYF
ncbi:GAF domain-containing protein [Calothrix sp. NIES-2098]|uniref:GAF domain-containing protein n=1 Tax=Calothrix sp. NIES-2098 TaxID=1954171 RepID=UPI000B6207D1|nr:adenylate and Guanylate cyclase catalytic domain protein [Calothrix sp. NIES-2098]